MRRCGAFVRGHPSPATATLRRRRPCLELRVTLLRNAPALRLPDERNTTAQRAFRLLSMARKATPISALITGCCAGSVPPFTGAAAKRTAAAPALREHSSRTGKKRESAHAQSVLCALLVRGAFSERDAI